VVLDIDETSLLNLGYEANDATHPGPFDPDRWDRWEKTGGQAVVAAPGLLQAATAAKESDVTLIYNSDRLTENAAETAATLTGAGLGPITHFKNLWLQGDVAPGPGKDPRRLAIAQQYCVIAMVGDQLGDFSDLFNAPDMTPQARRAAVAVKGIRTIWGHGWFIMPNPVYGTALKGGFDDAFPADKRWTDPGPAAQPGTTATQ
jgi:5'-nucleotidase (lipoprotein e(P4) family)